MDAATGRFRLDGLPAGRVRLRAFSMAANWIDGPEVEVSEAGPAEARIEYRGPELAATITVQTSSRPFYTEGHPEPESIVARDAGGSVHRAVHIAGSSSSYRIEGLSSGPYTVEGEDERYEPWRLEGVRPGTTLRVALKGRARVKLAVVDDATGAPIERYSLRACLDESRSFPNTFDVLSERSAPPSGGVVTGFMPLQTTLLVNGRATAVVPNPGGSDGNLCLGGALGRYNHDVQFADPAGRVRFELDLTFTPTPSSFVSILAGETWVFQAWHRDANPAQTSNFTDAVEIVFE